MRKPPLHKRKVSNLTVQPILNFMTDCFEIKGNKFPPYAYGDADLVGNAEVVTLEDGSKVVNGTGHSPGFVHMYDYDNKIYKNTTLTIVADSCSLPFHLAPGSYSFNGVGTYSVYKYDKMVIILRVCLTSVVLHHHPQKHGLSRTSANMWSCIIIIRITAIFA